MTATSGRSAFALPGLRPFAQFPVFRIGSTLQARMEPRIHFFALDPSYPERQFCGDFREGDGWTALPQGVTCPDCEFRLRAAATLQQDVLETRPEKH
jgi:hypothetical protein